MGTKVEYSVNLLSATSVDSNNNLSLKSVDVWENDRNKGLSNNNNNNKGDQIGTKRLQFSMERMVDTNNLEFIRKTMQMHEDIFKHQVEELHRVYRVQKLLMDDLKKEIKQKKLWKPINGEGMSQLQTTRNPNGATDLDLQAHPHSMKEDVGSRDKSSGSCSAEDIIVTKISTRGFDLEMPAEEEGTLTGECEAGPSAYTDEEIELDLTLSIGGSNNETYQKKKKKAKPHVVELSSKLNLCGSFKSDRVGGGECSDPTTPMSSSSVTFEQERKESSSSLWLSRQGLKLT